MEKINLKQIKEALNKIEDDNVLENFYITHKMAGFEDPEAEVGLVFFTDECDHEKYYKILEKLNIVSKFATEIFEDSKKAIASQLDDDIFEYYTEQDF